MKKNYTAPELEVLEVAVTDVITTSIVEEGGGED